jgi:hypothetical protein
MKLNCESILNDVKPLIEEWANKLQESYPEACVWYKVVASKVCLKETDDPYYYVDLMYKWDLIKHMDEIKLPRKTKCKKKYKLTSFAFPKLPEFYIPIYGSFGNPTLNKEEVGYEVAARGEDNIRKGTMVAS